VRTIVKTREEKVGRADWRRKAVICDGDLRSPKRPTLNA